MKLSRHIVFFLVCFLFYTIPALPQPGFKADIEKTAPYQERKLKAEKTGEGKIKTPKLILQNLTTRYNYFFNASNKFNEVLDKAREQHRDDYSQLLSFYGYDLETTAADSAQLDSVIYKARTGIVNHDLRNEWIDELYLLWAAAFHLQKKFDSASLMLQFINYAYAPKFEDGYYKHIGTNADGAKELSIATKEESKLLHSNTFSRNNAFVWQARTFIEMNDMTGAGSLITTLKRDPNFPKRLSNGLDEVEAYWWYRQKRWDSAAVHLLAAMDGAYTRREKARWNYLAAQLMERAGQPDEALKLFEKVVTMTPDPVMEVHARLNVVRLSKEGGEGALDRNLAELLKMARRDKYEEYRDVIYFMAAQMELQRGNVAAASELLIKGSKYNNGDQEARNKAFLLIADVSYDQKKYIQAAQFYDSVQVADLLAADANRVSDRKTALQKVVANSGVVYRQDSLQRIAALPPSERDAFVKSLVKKLRKQLGLKEDATVTAGGMAPLTGSGASAGDLFPTTQKGEWYFYNTASKTQGTAQFKSVWGNRPNADNWRRFAVVNQQSLSQPDQVSNMPDPNSPTTAAGVNAGNDLTFDGLSANLPLTPEALKLSNDSVRNALFGLGLAYLNDVEDYPSAISTFEELRRRFPDAEKMDEALFNLYYAYTKVGDAANAAQVKRLLNERYASSRFSTIAATGKDPQATTKYSPEATKAYEHVYNLFIEGRFQDAEQAKRIADSTYKTNFWQPQLLYIEAVYHIKQRQDSAARTVLQTIVRQNTNQRLSDKAQNLMDVLARRLQIEDELTKLQITWPVEDTITTQQPVAAIDPPVAKKDTVVTKPADVPAKDTAVASKPVTDPARDLAALAKQRQKEIADSIAQSKVTAKRLRDSLETARRDSLALAKKAADEARRDSLAQKAIADRQRKDSIALAKQQAAEARKDSLARKALADKQRLDSIALAKAAREQAKKDSVELAQALRRQATDAAALSKYLEKRERDSLARVSRDSIALVKQRAAQALSDSLARVALAEKQRKESLALLKKQAAEARADSLARVALETQKRRDSLSLAKAQREQARRDSIERRQALLQWQRDSAAAARLNAKPPVDPNAYHYAPSDAHYAVVILDKVDPIFVNEARTAFFRYNREKYYDQPMDVQIVNLTADTRMLLISGLRTASAAAEYVDVVKPLAPTEIIPWLTGNKYSFSIISARNLNLLKTKSNIEEYRRFLEQHLPGKF